MQTYWYAVLVERITDDFGDGIVLAEGVPEGNDIAPDSLDYLILARACSNSETDAKEIIADAVKEFGPKQYKLVADNVKYVIRPERKIAKQLQAGDVALKQSFIGFERHSKDATESAFRIVDQAVKRSWWQFWR